MNYIITKHPEFFDKIGQYNFCSLEKLSTLPDEVAFDSETTGLFAGEEDMFCCQIGDRTNNYIVHMYDDNYTFYDVIPYLEGKTLVMQNGLFDLGFMYKYNFIPEKVYDTMLASRVLYNGQWDNRMSDFKSIMHRELDKWYDKTDQKNIHLVKLSQPSAIQYSFNDVDRLQDAHDVLLRKIEQAGQISTYLLHCRFIKALAYMERCGLPINGDKWLDKMIYDKQMRDNYQKDIGVYIYDNVPQFADTQLDLFADFEKDTTVNLKSPKQMVEVFKALGIKVLNKDGKESIKEDIITKTKHEFVDLWLKYQEFQHRVSTFGRGVYDKIKNGRIYSNFNPMVDTARLSSRRGHINFLNFPSDKVTRDCFEAPEGDKMIVCDWSGQETVISADISGDVAMTKSVVEGADLHCLLAREIFPKLAELSDDEIVEKHSDKRKFAKAPRFAMQYGGNAYTLHVNENIPLKEAEAIYDKFINLHTGLFEWGERQLELAIKKGYIESADGWRLYLPKYKKFKELDKEINDMTKNDWQIYRVGKDERKREYMIWDKNKTKPQNDHIIFEPINKSAYEYYKKKRKRVSEYFSLRSEYQRLALNNPVQTTGSHQMKLALSYIFEWIIENDLMWTVKMCNAVHDETVIQAPEHLAGQVRDVVGEFMRKAGDHYLRKLKIKADANIGTSWYEAK
jgi:DNA polymerase I-like protein with 3'-5' exonuclease and polymerase domains